MASAADSRRDQRRSDLHAGPAGGGLRHAQRGADRVGSLEPGKIANLFIATGDPMEMKTQFTHVFINGRSVGLKSKHTELYERFSSRPGVQR